MKANEIRQKFLDFFKQKEHLIVPSAPLVVKNDPSLMFTNAGMNQFKDYFLGNKPAPSARIADTQKCLRVSGKHNDLEEVGMDTYHHTMFEMLGNWSFGDYFKEEAIAWAWELLTEVYELPKDRLYVTVFEGDKEDGVAADQEAADIWKKFVPDDRIIFANKKDNFWEMGDTGPCGPCSEIHIDLRHEDKRKEKDGKSLVNQDDPQVVEIWNLVFIQFNRKADKSLVPLPAKHVDTGMGFERLTMAIQGKQSNYDTDVFQPIIGILAEKAGKKYGDQEQVDIALRVIADHIRAIAFAIADGQMPSNNKAGYVIRRILRRAVRYGYTYLDFQEPFMHELIEPLSQQFGDIFPELPQQKEFIANSIKVEESAFLQTLANGLKRLDDIIKDKKPGDQIDGKVVFELYDTFGFPEDLTALVARENELAIDEKGFEVEMSKQKERARSAAAQETGDWMEIHSVEALEFLGYDALEVEDARIVKYREIKTKKDTEYQIVLDKTPFYAESGGQVGDAGVLEFFPIVAPEENPELRVPIHDTKKENDLIIHFTKKNNFIPLLQTGQWNIRARVKAEKRSLTENNHSATHLLHAALREVLGEHVAQKGSLVNEKYLRFDFSHNQKMSPEEMQEVEQIVNRKIRENIPLDERRNVPFKEATEQLGATGLFGEKYGDFVRVITFDENFSRELCGGTHVPATGKIGFFKITTETSVGTGIRRIEALTADASEAYVEKQDLLLQELKEMLRQPKDLKKAVESLLKERNDLGKRIEQLEAQQVQGLKQELIENAKEVEGIQVITQKISLSSAEALKQLAFDLKAQVPALFAVLGADIGGKPQIAVMISDQLVKERGLNAGKIVRELAKEIQGGGGGQDFFATAGGKKVEGLDAAIEKAAQILA